jgi:hypothetical protein
MERLDTDNFENFLTNRFATDPTDPTGPRIMTRADTDPRTVTDPKITEGRGRRRRPFFS